jgi:ABC-type nitrate/sulfonate/bicarbonate transport system permease component
MSRPAVAAARGLTVIVAALLLWQLLYGTNVLDHDSFSSASGALSALGHDLTDSTFWKQLRFTMTAWALGLVIGVAIGVALGLVLGLSTFAYRSLNLLVEFFKSIPAVAILPLVILEFGLTLKMNVALVVIGVTWPMLIQTAYGVRAVEPVVRDTARVYHMSRFDRLRNLILPSAAPYMATGFRLASTGALLLVIVAQLVGGGDGFGYGIFLAENSALLGKMYALVIAVGLLGILITFLVKRLERRVLRWHESQRIEMP